MPASRAVCSGSPLLTRPLRIARRASGDIVMEPRAIASRRVTGLSPTSTIFTRPRASTWDIAARRLRVFAIALCEKKRVAFVRYRGIYALKLQVGRHLPRPRRESEDGLDAPPAD